MLLDFYACSSFCQFSFELISLGLRNAFLDRLRCSVNEVLGFFKSESCNDFANNFDHCDLVAAGSRKNYVKRILFLSRSSIAASASRSASAR